MEVYSDTLDDRKIRLAVIAIETAAKKLGISPSDFCARLTQYDLIEKRLFKYYDTLHTQNQSYVADDIIETLRNYESKERGKDE